jgi:hypothetical protein
MSKTREKLSNANKCTDIEVKQKWSISMKIGTFSTYSVISDIEPNKEIITAFLKSAHKNVGWINKKIEISTWYEVL